MKPHTHTHTHTLRCFAGAVVCRQQTTEHTRYKLLFSCQALHKSGKGNDSGHTSWWCPSSKALWVPNGFGCVHRVLKWKVYKSLPFLPFLKLLSSIICSLSFFHFSPASLICPQLSIPTSNATKSRQPSSWSWGFSSSASLDHSGSLFHCSLHHIK